MMTTLMLIILLAWLTLSIVTAVLVGKCIKFASGLASDQADSLVAPKHGVGRRPRKIFREQTSV